MQSLHCYPGDSRSPTGLEVFDSSGQVVVVMASLGSDRLPSASRGYFATKMKSQFFQRIDTLEMDLPNPAASDASNDGLICSFSGTDLLAYALSNCLTIAKLSEQSDEIIDLEFESSISIISWDSRGRCLILADTDGSLHLITSKGQILFSKKITTGFLPLLSPSVSLSLTLSLSLLDHLSEFSI
jgi:hypothetical protein